jgi:hypothetical protein
VNTVFLWRLPRLGLFSLLLSASQVNGQEDRERAAATLENGRVEAALYTIHPADRDDDKSIKLHAEPVLKWHNSVDQSVYGNIFVWTRAGRPEAVASIYQFYSPKIDFCAEFQSLSLSGLVATKDGKEVWTPKEPGIVLKAFDDAAEPSPSKPQRLVEMRKLAGQFSVQLTDYSRETYRLRLLPRPLLRYGSPDEDVLDGALFAFTYTTDPELLVMVEARKTDKGRRWHYGHARMNIGELKVSYRDREIWTAERLEYPYLRKEAVYTLFQGLSPLKGPKSG